MEDGSLSFRPNLSFKLMWIVYLTAASVVGFFFVVILLFFVNAQTLFQADDCMVLLLRY